MKQPTIYIMVGLPASGKSTFASVLSILSEDCEKVWLSSDELRKELFGDENVQDKNNILFEEMQRRAVVALKEGKDVIYDATNICRKDRRHILGCLPKNVYKVAIVTWCKYDICVERDKHRERTVGEDVIKKMICRFQPPFYDEGFDEIRFRFFNDYHYDNIVGNFYTDEDYKDWMNCEHENPHHKNTVGEHTQKMLECLRENKLMSLAYNLDVLENAIKYHDCGKKFVKSFINARGDECDEAHYYNHQNVGSYFVIGMMGYDQKYSHDEVLLVSWLVNNHMEPFFKSKYYEELPLYLKSLIDIIHECDVNGA